MARVDVNLGGEMAGLTKEQFEEVQSLIAKQSEGNQKLSAGQKWEAGVMIGAFTALAIALLGFGGRAVVETAAKQGASNMTGSIVAANLRKDPDFVNSIALSAPSLPSGSIIAISTDKTEGGDQLQCPPGWSFFAEGAGQIYNWSGCGKRSLSASDRRAWGIRSAYSSCSRASATGGGGYRSSRTEPDGSL